MVNKRKPQQKKETPMNNEPQLSPEMQAHLAAEKRMNEIIEEKGMDGMIEQQISWKFNDVKAKIPAQSNVKAWFETAYELSDINDKGLLMATSIIVSPPDITKMNDFKVKLYENIAEVYESITPDMFGKKDFVNPFAEIWERYEGHRCSVEQALEELYAWSICEDPILWAASINGLVLEYNASQFVEENELI